jgi:hypothetical protein
MTYLDELRSLAKRVCEEAPSRELDAEVAVAMGYCIHPWSARERSGAQSDTGFTCTLCGADSWGNKGPKGERLSDNKPCTTSLDVAASLMPVGWSVDVCVFANSATVRAFRNSPPLTTTDVIRAPTEPQARTAAALLAMAVDLENENLSSLDDASNTIQKVFGLEADDAAQIGLSRYVTGIVSNTSEQNFENDK